MGSTAVERDESIREVLENLLKQKQGFLANYGFQKSFANSLRSYLGSMASSKTSTNLPGEKYKNNKSKKGFASTEMTSRTNGKLSQRELQRIKEALDQITFIDDNEQLGGTYVKSFGNIQTSSTASVKTFGSHMRRGGAKKTIKRNNRPKNKTRRH
jgi:hypothetical protein